MRYYVYEIVIAGERRYVGITNDVKRRQTQHRTGLKKQDKYLYRKIREAAPETAISLAVIAEFDNKGDAARWEAKLILDDYFSGKKLWQSFPIAIKYF